MEEEKKEHKLIQSYVVEKYFISTAYRRSSAATETPIWYYETVIFEWDKDTKECGAMIEQLDSGMSPAMALQNHFKAIIHSELLDS